MSILSARLGPLEPANIAIVGDRKMTDIYLGNRSGWMTILVPPIEPTSPFKHGLGVYMMRKL